MKNKKRTMDLVDAGFLVLRTPVLPFDELLRWTEGIHSCEELAGEKGADGSATAWKNDLQLLRVRLREIVHRPEVRQALFIASPSLESSIESWEREPDSKKGLQTERSLVRYFARMCGRPTPFGLFSGCSVSPIASHDNENSADNLLPSLDQCRPSSRLDFDYLFALTDGLKRDPNLSAELRFWPNSSLRKIGSVWHYIESRVAGADRSHNLVKLYADSFLDCILDRATSGAMVPELVASLRTLPEASEITDEEARDYIQELIASSILVSSLTPLVTGPPALDELIAQLELLPSGRSVAAVLTRTRAHLSELDRRGPGVPVSEYREIAAELEKLPAKVDLSRLFQVDLIKPCGKALLPRTVVDELLTTVELGCLISRQSEHDDIVRFREAFQDRYQQAWVPLVQVLDEDAGIGFGSSGNDTAPLLRGLRLGGNQGSGAHPTLEALLQRKMRESASARQIELVLQESELPVNADAGRYLADYFACQLTLVAASMQSVREGNFRVSFQGAVGPTGAQLLGRFCQADPELETQVRRFLKMEEALDPDAVYAEIVHLPEGRIGNVLCRPVLRDYEIVYMGRSGAAVERQIPISDLLVSVASDGTILLYSQRLNRRVIPRLSNAHGFFNPQLASIYRFLCYLQHQNGVTGPSGFRWGALDSMDFLPRVLVGRVVLAQARWRLTSEQTKLLDKPDRRECFRAMQDLRHELGLPRWLLFSESDNALPVDLDNPLSVDAFVHVLKRTKDAILTEMYPLPDDLCVTSPEGRFRHELLLPIVRRQPPVTKAGASPIETALSLARRPVPASVRQLPPGSDWLYLKHYGGPAALEDLLLAEVPLLLQKAREQGILSSWFFLRYADPHQHLRIRFQGPANNLCEKMPLLVRNAFNSVLTSGRIWRVQFDTYEREVERYGGIHGVELAEEIFFADSEAVLEILKATEGDEGQDLRWRVALLGVDRLLADCGMDVNAKHSTMKHLRDSYHQEFQVGVESEKAIGDRYRRERRRLEALLQNPSPDDSMLITAVQALDTRSARLREVVRKLSDLAAHGDLCTSMVDLAASYVHMHVNRMLRSSQRAHELIIYDFLFRLYDSELARRGNPRERVDASVETVGAAQDSSS